MMLLGLTGKDILALTNESKRKAILAGWQNWGSWYEGDDFFPGGGTHNVNRPRFNLGDKGGKLKSGSKAESLLTDKLKELRKELLNHGA